MKQMCKFLFFIFFLNKDHLFYFFCMCASREMDGITFSCQMTHVFEALLGPL